MMVEYIKCGLCGKTIEKKGSRVLCIACSNKRNKEVSRAYREMHRDEIRYKNKERAKIKREALKRDE